MFLVDIYGWYSRGRGEGREEREWEWERRAGVGRAPVKEKRGKRKKRAQLLSHVFSDSLNVKKSLKKRGPSSTMSNQASP